MLKYKQWTVLGLIVSLGDLHFYLLLPQEHIIKVHLELKMDHWGSLDLALASITQIVEVNNIHIHHH